VYAIKKAVDRYQRPFKNGFFDVINYGPLLNQQQQHGASTALESIRVKY